MLYIVRHPNYGDVTMAYAEIMVSTKALSTEEHSILEDPIIITNFNSMLQDIMVENSATWEAFSVVSKYKKQLLILILGFV